MIEGLVNQQINGLFDLQIQIYLNGGTFLAKFVFVVVGFQGEWTGAEQAESAEIKTNVEIEVFLPFFLQPGNL